MLHSLCVSLISLITQEFRVFSKIPDFSEPLEKVSLPALTGSTTNSGGNAASPPAPAPFIKAEANLLRFPFFALKTKGLKAVTGYECRGKLARDGVVYKFTYKTSRNVETTYPGALSRSVHLAFLNLLSEQGTPLQNPISWTWRDLCRRMGISCSGRAINDLKQAILATRGVIIFSDQALYSKPDSKPICTQKETVGLYERVVFLGADLPDGEGPADKNYLWLSQWYLDNLNALFTAPLNHELWLHLEQRSSIASRLYEFLLLNFHATPILRINYEKLAKFLPIRVEKHLSQAKQQLNAALEQLVEAEVLSSFEWQKGKNNQVILQFQRGRHCGATTAIVVDAEDQIELDISADEEFANIEIKEKRLPPEYLIVDEFNRQWQRSVYTEPTIKEMALARELLERFGATKLRQLIPVVVKKLKAKWPDAKSFGSVAKYIDEAEQSFTKEQSKVDDDRKMTDLAVKRRQEEAVVLARNEALKKRWKELPDGIRREIEQKVAEENPALRNHALFIEAIRLEEMVNRGLAPGI